MLDIELYEEKHKEQLANLYLNYFKEVHPEDTCGTFEDALAMLDVFDTLGRATFVVTKDNTDLIGFVTLFCNTQYNMTKPIVYVDYMFVLPEYRNGLAVAMLYTKIGEVCKFNNMDCLGATFTTSANNHNNRLVNGKVIAGVTHFKLQDIVYHTDRLHRFLEKGKKRWN